MTDDQVGGREADEAVGRDASPSVEPVLQLTPFEREFAAYAGAGDQLDPMKDQATDVSEGAHWGPERTLRAEVLAAIVTGALGTVHRRGVQLRGARVQGTVDLSWSQLAQPLSLVECYFDEPFLARGVKLKDLVMSGSRMTVLDLAGATVKGGVFLNQGFSAIGCIRLLGADIAGQLNCSGATLANDGGDALTADQATVKGGVFLDESFGHWLHPPARRRHRRPAELPRGDARQRRRGRPQRRRGHGQGRRVPQPGLLGHRRGQPRRRRRGSPRL